MLIPRNWFVTVMISQSGLMVGHIMHIPSLLSQPIPNMFTLVDINSMTTLGSKTYTQALAFQMSINELIFVMLCFDTSSFCQVQCWDKHLLDIAL